MLDIEGKRGNQADRETLERIWDQSSSTACNTALKGDRTLKVVLLSGIAGAAVTYGLFVFHKPQPVTTDVPFTAVTSTPMFLTQTGPVGSKIPGLTAQKSVVTGVLDPRSLSGSYYWTMVLHNETFRKHEARMTMKIPDGAVVSRATLWVNGMPQEAAFNTTARVEAAYDSISCKMMDPLLVKQLEPGKVLIKASPVPAYGSMQIRLGITVPATVTHRTVAFKMPTVQDANFVWNDKHNVHITSTAPLLSNDSAMSSTGANGTHLCRGNVSADNLGSLVFKSPTVNRSYSFATRATHSSAPSFIHAAAIPFGLRLIKSSTLTTRRFINDEDVAHRLSTLWAHQEIERLAAHGQETQAGELANAYRVVSSVSGATVLQSESDYASNQLDRDMYRTVSYSPSSSMQQAPALQGATDGFSIFSPRQALSQSFSTVVNQLNQLNSYSGSAPVASVPASIAIDKPESDSTEALGAAALILLGLLSVVAASIRMAKGSVAKGEAA